MLQIMITTQLGVVQALMGAGKATLAGKVATLKADHVGFTVPYESKGFEAFIEFWASVTEAGHELPTVPENRPLTTQDVLNIINARLNVPGLTTLSEMGAASLDSRTRFMPAAALPAVVQQLFANQDLLQQITSPDSRLKEKGSEQLQEKVTELLTSQQQLNTAHFQLSDTHKTRLGSVCDPSLLPVPDLTLHLAGRPAIPISTAAVIDLKRQDKGNEVEDPCNVGQVVLYAQGVLRRVPRDIRSSVLAAVTDMKSILWLKVERSSGGGFTTRAEPLRHDVMASICALMQADPLVLQVDLPRVSLGGCPLAVDEVLGEGSTSIVYRCSGSSLGVDAVAIKVPKEAYRSQGQQLLDAEVLRMLFGVAGVPQLVDVVEVKHGRGDSAGRCRSIAMWPVVEPLSSLEPGERRAVCLCIDKLVACLKAAHAAGLVNRDIRPENLGRHKRKDGTTQLYILDWGYAAFAVGVQGPYLGTLRYASDSVLLRLARGEAAAVAPSDDLISLVRALMLWKCEDLQRQLAAATGTGSLTANAQACFAFWQESARLMPPWRRLEGVAGTRDYAAVSIKLRDIMCC